MLSCFPPHAIASLRASIGARHLATRTARAAHPWRVSPSLCPNAACELKCPPLSEAHRRGGASWAPDLERDSNAKSRCTNGDSNVAARVPDERCSRVHRGAVSLARRRTNKVTDQRWMFDSCLTHYLLIRSNAHLSTGVRKHHSTGSEAQNSCTLPKDESRIQMCGLSVYTCCL